MKLLQDKVAIITGATRGIGRGIALKFAEQGANIAFTYLSSAQKAAELEAELQAYGVKAKGYNSDAAVYAAAEELVKRGFIILPYIFAGLLLSYLRMKFSLFHSIIFHALMNGSVLIPKFIFENVR